MKSFLFTITLSSLFYCSSFELDMDSNNNLLKSLYSDLNWEVMEFSNDSILISQKEIVESNLNAIKVEKIVNIHPELFSNVIMNVADYDSFLTNAESFKSEVIQFDKTGLIGYQHIIVDFPFIDDREYYFYMSTKPPSVEFNNLISFWILIDPDKNKNSIKKTEDLVYLSQGAGLWKWEKNIESKSFKISYILTMHPGGALPEFLIEIINQNSIITLFRDVINKTVLENKNDQKYD